MRPAYEAPETRKAEGPLAASMLRRSSPVVAFSSAMLLRALPRERLQRTTAPGSSGFAEPAGTARSGPPLPSSLPGAACDTTESVHSSAPRSATRGRAHAAETSSGDGRAGAAIAMARNVMSAHDRSTMMGAACAVRPAALAHTLTATLAAAAKAAVDATERTPTFASAMANAPEGVWLAIVYVMLRGRSGATGAS